MSDEISEGGGFGEMWEGAVKGFHWEKKKVLENSVRDRRDEML